MKLRSKPQSLSRQDVEEILIERNFYDVSKNPDGKGMRHSYKVDNINGDKIVIDKSTHLMWQQEGTKDTVSFTKAKSIIQNMNKRGFAGHSDWRMPTLEEAMSVLERDSKASAFHIDEVFNTTQDLIWTCDPIQDEAGEWAVNYFNGGYYYGIFHDDAGFYVRAVRSL
ncbi:DUF1566 domain-containing protein [candidate division KSB1 bacterium]|nr:MAG: DUF1566 domain-containing protein [candidate division KSB1 bacterium]